jgi:hypothetical protein
MYIAAKYEEMYPPALEEFSFITDNTYETKHILRMEQIVIKVSLEILENTSSSSSHRCSIFLSLILRVISSSNII